MNSPYPYPPYQQNQRGAGPGPGGYGAGNPGMGCGWYGQNTGLPPMAGGIPPVAPAPAASPEPQESTGFLEPTNPAFIKGALVGAALAYLLTNEKVQQAGIKGAARAWQFMQGGIEEMKERFRDAEAELNAEAFEE